MKTFTKYSDLCHKIAKFLEYNYIYFYYVNITKIYVKNLL